MGWEVITGWGDVTAVVSLGFFLASLLARLILLSVLLPVGEKRIEVD
jgi:hypothetical protein